MGKSFGLDIGSFSLKGVELEIEESRPKLLHFGSVPTPLGASVSEAEIDQSKLAHSIKVLLHEAHIQSRQVITAFPESQIFTRVIELPAMKDKELENALKWQADQYIPSPLDQVKLSWMVLQRGIKKGKEEAERIRVLLVAAPGALINRYVNIIGLVGLEPVAFETELVAIVRSLTSTQEKGGPTTLLISIGASTTDLCIVDQGVIQFTRSIGSGGTALAKAISQQLGFEMSQAEEYKKTYGLREDQLEGKIVAAIKPVFDVIVNEIKGAILSYQTSNPTAPVKRIVLTGGTAQLPGMVVYLAESLGIEVQIGNPWVNIDVPSSLEEEVLRVENQTQFSVAVGLALREG